MSARSRCRTGSRDEQVLFLSDIFPTGYMAAEFCDLKGGETVAIWGCGPVGQFAIRSAFLLGAERVIAIDTVPERLALARSAGAETIDFMEDDVYDRIMEMTKGRGADACIDAVGTEADTGSSFDGEDRPHQGRRPSWAPTGRTCCVRPFIAAATSAPCRSIGVYGGFLDKIPIGSAINRGLTFRMAQTPVQRYLPKLLQLIEEGKIDPSCVITHIAPLEKGPELYKTFRDKQDGCIKVVLKPGLKEAPSMTRQEPAHA